MSLDIPFLIVSAIVLANIALSVFFSLTTHASSSSRTRLLWKLVAAYGTISTIVVIIFSALYWPLSALNLGTGIFYALVGTFVFTIEIPGYLLLSRQDQRILDFLEDWRSELVALGHDFQNFAALKTKSEAGEGYFKEVILYRLVHDFIEHIGRLQNLDKGLWALLIGEINRAIDRMEVRSKHPAPKLIEILSLSGLSLIIAQLLKVLG